LPTFLARVAAAAVLAAAGAGVGVAGPASAAASVDAPLSLHLSGATLTPGQLSVDHSIGFNLSDSTIRQVNGLQVTIDTAALPAGVTADTSNNFFWDCTTASTVIACSYEVTANANWLVYSNTSYLDSSFSLTLTAAKGSAPATGSVSVTATADGLNTASTTARYAIARNVYLKGGAPDSLRLKAGDTYQEQFAVTNAGTPAVHGVWLWVDSDRGFNYTTKFSNCRYNAEHQALCYFANDLAPGVTYQVGTPMPFRIKPSHQVPFGGATLGTWYTPLDLTTNFTNTPSGTKGTGPALTLVAADGTPAPALTKPHALQSDKHYENSSWVDIALTGTNATNLAAVGGAGAFGTPLAVGVTDLGAADANMSRSGDSVSSVKITVPTGTKATVVPAACAPIVAGQDDWDNHGAAGYAAYDCPVYQDVLHGRQITFPFTFEPTAAQPTYTGSVTITPNGTPADDTASFTLS
jgi:hypothetical protein